MDRPPDPLTLEQQVAYRGSRCPRLWGLVLGAVLLAMGAGGAWNPTWLTGWEEEALQNLYLTCSLLMLGGFMVMLRASASDMMRIHSLQISQAGIEVDWSHVPHLTQARIRHATAIPWGEVSRVEWEESWLESDFKQHLTFHVQYPLHQTRHHFRVLLCDHWDHETCRRFLQMLPWPIEIPHWYAHTPTHSVSEAKTVR